MSISSWFVAVAAVALAMILAKRRPPAPPPPFVGESDAERASRPEALLDAELIYVEKPFRASWPVSLIARIDRAYRTPAGVVVLVEFKSRWIRRPFLSDVIQLSVQKVALRRQTGLPVAGHGCVVVKAPAKAAAHTSHRVELMTEREVAELARRRALILSGRERPRYTEFPKMCGSCAFRDECEATRLSAGGRPEPGSNVAGPLA